MNVFDDYLVDPKLSLLDKTRIQAQVLVPVLRALRSELGKEKADAIVKEALRGWSKNLCAAIGDSVDGSPRRKWAAMHSAMGAATERDVRRGRCFPNSMPLRDLCRLPPKSLGRTKPQLLRPGGALRDGCVTESMASHRGANRK
jgi:hypothetical protein